MECGHSEHSVFLDVLEWHIVVEFVEPLAQLGRIEYPFAVLDDLLFEDFVLDLGLHPEDNLDECVLFLFCARQLVEDCRVQLVSLLLRVQLRHSGTIGRFESYHGE